MSSWNLFVQGYESLMTMWSPASPATLQSTASFVSLQTSPNFETVRSPDGFVSLWTGDSFMQYCTAVSLMSSRTFTCGMPLWTLYTHKFQAKWHTKHKTGHAARLTILCPLRSALDLMLSDK